MLNEEISLNGNDPLHFQVILFTAVHKIWYRNSLECLNSSLLVHRGWCACMFVFTRLEGIKRESTTSFVLSSG